jgi:hypothetical protein
MASNDTPASNSTGPPVPPSGSHPSSSAPTQVIPTGGQPPNPAAGGDTPASNVHK